MRNYQGRGKRYQERLITLTDTLIRQFVAMDTPFVRFFA
jgi:hypothetical protein